MQITAGRWNASGLPFQPSSNVTAPHAGESDATVLPSRPDDGLSAFLKVRPRLFSIAYRMLRSAAEAEDVVQDVWVRWQTADRSMVRDAAAFLATTTTRVAINVMQSARSRRETYIGPWLPEPVDTSADPASGAERGKALAAGIQRLLQRLSPSERAAYILREAFDYPYRDIAIVLRLGVANARQVVSRARQHIANGRTLPTNSTDHTRLLRVFVAAAHNGDVAALEETLCAGCRCLTTQQQASAARTGLVDGSPVSCERAAA